MKTILTILLITLSCYACRTIKPTKVVEPLITEGSIFTLDSNQTKGLATSRLYAFPYTPDTIPVILFVADTSIRGHGTTFSINGYNVINKYLNHLKQPLPERLIVWMAVRRKER